MIHSLFIQNLILIEKAHIEFREGLNIITGETGSGKSAILSAIKLLCGARADHQLIRKGATVAVIEANIDGKVIRREIHSSGKNRCFIDDQLSSLSHLQELLNIEMIDQSISTSICSTSNQRQILDDYCKIDLDSFKKSFQQEKELEKKLEELKKIPKEKELNWAQKDLEELEDLNLSENEEELLTQEHHVLTHSQQIAEKMGSTSSSLEEAIPLLKRLLTNVDSCSRLDHKITQFSTPFKSAILELEEVAIDISRYTDNLESDPTRIEYVEQRLKKIDSLQRRFGMDLNAHKEILKRKIDALLSIDDEIKVLETELLKLKELNIEKANNFSALRKRSANEFAQQVLNELKDLNIPHAKFEIKIQTVPMTASGIDNVEFMFSANPGSSVTALQDCASGGELSRFMLAVKTILTDKSACIVFDEIDSNVGGATASVIGQKLQKLSQNKQVICVTHFVQVAKCANEHFLVCKIEKNGINITEVKKLFENEKQTEYNRMLGLVHT